MQSDENDDEYVIDSSVASGQSNNLSSSTSISDDEEIYTKCSKNKKEDEEEFDDSSPIYVPDNPTSWEEKHIETWVKWCAKNFSINNPKPDPKRFPKTGVELAKFTKADFYMTCGSLEGGKCIMQNFKYFMENIGKENDLEESLKSDEEPSKFKIFLKSNVKRLKN